MKRLILLLMLATSVILAQEQADDDDKVLQFPGRTGICGRLNLNEDQQAQFDKLQSDMQKNRIMLRAKMQTLRLEVKDLFNEENPARSKIEAKTAELTKLQNDMKLNRIDFWFAVNKILKPEQQKIWKYHQNMLGKRMGEKQMQGMRGRDQGKRIGHRGKGMNDCPLDDYPPRFRR